MSSVGFSQNVSSSLMAAAQNKTRINLIEAKSLSEQASIAAQELLATEVEGKEAKRTRSVNVPQLTAPKSEVPSEQGDKLNHSARLTELLGKMSELMGDVSIQQLETRLDVYSKMSDALRAQGDALASDVANAMADFEQAAADTDMAEDAYITAKSQTEAKQKALEDAKKVLAGMKPGDPGYDEAAVAVEKAEGELAQAKEEEKQAKQKYENAVVKADAAMKKCDDLLEQAKSLESAYPGAVEQESEQNLTNMARLTQLMAMFIQMVGDNAETNLENELEVNRALQASRQQEMEQKSAEYEEQVRKAEETQKVMGCIAKIIMPVLTVIGVVGAAFSGGASLALAGIGLALMAADAATDGAVTSAIMNPIMEHVFTPLMEFLGDVVKKVLELPVISDLLALLDKATGVDVTGIVTMAVTVLATVAVMVAAMYLTKSAGNAAAKMMGPLVKLIGDQIKKMIPALLKNVSKKSVSTLSKANTQLIEKVGLKSDALSAQRYANNISSAQTGVAATHTGVQAVGTIIQGEAYQKATDALADFKMAKADIERLNNWLTQSVERWSDSLSTTNQMVTKMSNMQQQQQATGIFILNHTHA